MELPKKSEAEISLESNGDTALLFDAEMMRHVEYLRNIEGKGDSDIEKVYKDSVVFLTGGTGFLGKQLIEKLLRACPGVKKIYLLCRSKKGTDFKQRLNNILEEPVFDEIKLRCPDFKTRLVAIEGDVASLRLGINEDDWQSLTEEVNFFFHAAATVRFEEPIKVAIQINTRGTREAILFAKACKNLRCMVYVSTAYTHCNRSEIKEQFYKCPVPPNTMIELVESVDQEKLNACTPELIKDWPNTYTFSKALGEEMVRTMCQGMPVCVVRPAAVVPSYYEPRPGWVDISNVYGPSGTFLGSALGILRVAYIEPTAGIEAVPVDYVNNLTIATAWDTIKRHEKGDKDIKIYTLSRKRKPETWSDIDKRCQLLKSKMITPKALWYTNITSTNNYYMFWILVFFYHWIPSLFIDAILAISGSKLRIRPMHSKSHKMNIVLSYFSFRSWIHHDDNTLELYKKLPKMDQKIFKFDMGEIDITSFAMVWFLGIRKYIIKDSLLGTKQAARKQFWLHKIHLALCVLYALALGKIFLVLCQIIAFCFQLFVSYLPENCSDK